MSSLKNYPIQDKSLQLQKKYLNMKVELWTWVKLD